MNKVVKIGLGCLVIFIILAILGSLFAGAVIKRLIGRDGIPIYPFLRNNPGERHEFIKRWLECYRVYIEGDFEEIPDFDPKTGKHNQDYLCLKCPNWDQLCSSKRIKRS